MLTFEYEAKNAATGQKVKSIVQADSEQAAAKIIKDQGLAPLSIELQKESKKGFFNKVRSKDRVLFARQLSTLINAGLPLVQSLRNVQQQTTSKALRAIISEVIIDVEGGNNFSAALQKHPQAFSPVFTSMVAAGEVSGTLDVSLERIANQQEKDAEIVSKIRGAMAYPAVVILVMIAVVGFMVVSVIPQVKVLYEDIPGANLPLVTRILVAVSDFIIHFWWLFLILLIIAIVFGSRWARSIGGKRFIDKAKLTVKPVSRLYKKMYMARFARTGGTLVASGVPLIQMLEVTAQAINNVYIEESINRAIEQVKGGKSLGDALQGDPNFLELVPNMLHIGEQSGSTEEMMNKVADYYEKEVDNEIKTISTIIEPALMILLGVVALIIVAAVLLPIYGLAGKTIIR
ncbi:MAG TPA: type II secretion system F family protein [Candidatus Saccharibacteria bacterium]|nr:type II secretion system F family protein [Candidatus Saccharibacteria bacterium]